MLFLSILSFSISNNNQGITILYKYQKELHGCSADWHISHLYSARAEKKIKTSINFEVGKIPVMEFGTTEQRKFYKQLLEYETVC